MSTNTATADESFWDSFTNWVSNTWTKFKAWVKSLAKKFAAAFEAKERDAEGRITNQSWFGKWIVSPALRVLSFVGTAVVWLAKAAAIVVVGVLLTVALLVIALVIAAALLVVGIVMVAYRVLLGIGLIFKTPYAAYHDREKSDRDWELYWKSWHPKFWATLSLSDVEAWEEYYQQVHDEHFVSKATIFETDTETKTTRIKWENNFLNGPIEPEVA